MSKEAEYLRRVVLTGMLPELTYRLRISKEDRLYIKEIKDQLYNNSSLNFILYFNHISYNDPLLAAYIVQQIDPKHSRHLIAPASYSHTNSDNPANRGFSLMINEAKRCGIEIVRVIQTYQVGNPKYGYTMDQAQSTYHAWMRRLKELQSSGTPTGCLISPEGTRSDDGILGAGEPGILATGRFLAPVIYIPLGISYDSDYKRNGFNIGKKINLVIGESIFQNESKDYPSLGNIMSKLASTLPLNMRGEWLD